MTAIILAGGLGTRLKSVINDLPKCMAPINQIPFLTYLLKKLSFSGFKKVILCVSYLKEKVIEYYGDNFENIEIVYSVEESPLGTGGAIIQALKSVTEEYAFVLNGDTYFDIDFKRMIDINKDFVIAANYVDDVSRYGELIVKEDVVINFLEKGTKKKGLINGGIYYFNKSFLLKFQFQKIFSWEKEFLEKHYSKLLFHCVSFSSVFIDIGVPLDYLRAQDLLTNE